MGISEGRHPLHRPGDRSYHSLGNHVIVGVLNLLLLFYGHLPSHMLDWGIISISPGGVGSRHVANCVKQAGKGAFEGNYVPGHCIREDSWLSQIRVIRLGW